METTTGSPSPSSPERTLSKLSPVPSENTRAPPPLRISTLGPTEVWKPGIGFCETGEGVPVEIGNAGYAGVIGGGDVRPISSPNGGARGGGVPDFGDLGRDWDCCMTADGKANPPVVVGDMYCCGSRSLIKAGFNRAVEER